MSWKWVLGLSWLLIQLLAWAMVAVGIVHQVHAAIFIGIAEAVLTWVILIALIQASGFKDADK